MTIVTPFDLAYIVVDLATGFASIRDMFEGLEMWEADSLQEALAWLAVD